MAANPVAMANSSAPLPTDGRDGTDHIYRQQVASQYQTSALNKSRLRTCISIHYSLFSVMLSKLLADILDRLDIFILEIEELRIPQPLYWEYIWCLSLACSFLGVAAARKNRIKPMQQYVMGLVVFGYLPLLYAIVHYFSDVWAYLVSDADEDSEELAQVHMWQSMCYGLLNYGFILAALQVHSFSIYFALNLIGAWKTKVTKKID